jgi:transitional endoplasmic reticulum ATPase
MPPYFVEQNKFAAASDDLERALVKARKEPLQIVSTSGNLEANTLVIIAKALHPDPAKRFASATQFISALEGAFSVGTDEGVATTISSGPRPAYTNSGTGNAKKENKGFAAIAGMRGLKDLITHDVINALKQKEKYAEYGLSIPNGMLLYGPPGCGKTFFAERMAEEIGFNFFLIKPSDIQSKFVNASQEIIKTLFDEARKQAPSIIFLDELDALVPRRDTPNMSQMNANAVNEFLAQMNNTGDEGIFIIGASNRPTSVDPAILRSGRLDKLIYLPPPDIDARREMFELHLAKRPIGGIIDYAALARKTDNFVSSDIRFLCDEAARRALRSGSKITNDIALETIGANRPSLTLAVLETYKSMKSELEGVAKGQRNQIGFNRK